MNLSSSYQPALGLKKIVEDTHCLRSLKCYFFYIPHFFLTRPVQQRIRISVQHRKELRRTILQKLLEAGIKLSDSQQKIFCDINNLPNLPNGFISVSHCPGLQGFIYSIKQSGKQKRIGLDVEVRSRVTMDLVSFLSSKTELDNMPNPACLWTAKEASFKCLYPQDIRISQIIIGYWESISSDLYRFGFFTPCGIYGQGYSCIWKQWTIAFAHT